MGAVGSLKTPIARYVVFGVDPNDPNHLIAPDVENGAMKFSTDCCLLMLFVFLSTMPFWTGLH